MRARSPGDWSMQDVMSLKGKTIVITGAAQGIGQAIATLAIGLGGTGGRHRY
jgi:hypothetical protein